MFLTESAPSLGISLAVAVGFSRHSGSIAAMLVGVLTGANPASGTCPVAAVVISGDGEGDQPVESPEVKVLVGRMRIWSAPNRRASKAAGRSASEP